MPIILKNSFDLDSKMSLKNQSHVWKNVFSIANFRQ